MHDASEPEVKHSHDENDSAEELRDDEDIQSEVTLLRNEMNNGYNLRKSTMVKHVYATLNVKTASSLFGGGVTLELNHCLTKGVFTGLSPIPSKMFLTPKKLPSGALDKIKARLVAGGHRQDRSLYTDQETSSPTVSLTAVFAQAAIAAQRGDHVLTLDHKAAYLNATMKGPAVKMILSKEVSSALCEIGDEYKAYLRKDRTILVQLQKALSNQQSFGTMSFRRHSKA
jgi:Reverse transcriptase (RNA-dependent DNA polymerase)